MRIVAALAMALLLASGDAAADARVTAGGATVTFPLGTPTSRNGERHGQHGDPTLMLFIFTFDKTTISPGEEATFQTDMAGMRNPETWTASDEASKQGFSFITMPFPNRLAARVWADKCQPPTKEHPFICRPIRVGGVSGREYVSSGPDPTRPGERPYIVQQVVVRNDRLYLLSYSGAEDASRPASKHPATPAQRAFLRSLRFSDR